MTTNLLAELPGAVRSSVRARILLLTVASAAGCAPTFLERAATEPGAVKLPTGAVLKPLRAGGNGPIPQSGDRVRLAYEGRLVDGKVFATSRGEGGVVEAPLDAVSRCWREALSRMHPGDKARITCVSDSARGEAGPQAPEGTTVTFDLELLLPGAAEEVELPAGLVIRTLRPGSGAHPRATDKVKVHYEGRLGDGTVFDSSIARGEPAEFPLNGVISCWRYGVQKMQVGEKVQLTCPPDIAYGAKGQPPSIPPNATLTFDVELIEILH